MLWANSKVSFQKGNFGKDEWAFAVDIYDEVRQKDLTVGGLGKFVPLSLRLHNFYKIIEILGSSGRTIQEKLRLANNAAPGSGKTGDMALLKLWAYLADIPCVAILPDNISRDQTYGFDKEFLPDIVANTFVKSFSANNTKYSMSTFDEMFHKNCDILNNLYGKENKNNPVLVCIDEVLELKKNPKLLEKLGKLSCYNPIVIFSATPSSLLNGMFGIKQQILLSPKEKVAFGIGKTPVVYNHKTKFSNEQEMNETVKYGKSHHDPVFASPIRSYVYKVENTHERLNGWESVVEQFRNESKIQESEKNLSQLFLHCISKSMDSQVYKVAIIAAEENEFNDIRSAIFYDDNYKVRERQLQESFIMAIKELKLGLSDDMIKLLVRENLNVKIGHHLLPSIKLYNVIDTLNEYKKHHKGVTKDEIKHFIKKKYKVIDSHEAFNYNSKLTDALFKLSNIDQKYLESIERNYPGDKRLHEYVFRTFPEIETFCKQDVMILTYADKGIERFSIDKESNNITADYIIWDNSADYAHNVPNIYNVRNMTKSGFIPITISKELAIGFDSKRIDMAAAIITKNDSEILDPMFLFQMMGRVGRHKRKGHCFFDIFTTHKNYLTIWDINELSGNELLERLEKSYKSYERDMIKIGKLTLSEYDNSCYDDQVTNGASTLSSWISNTIRAFTSNIVVTANQLYSPLKNFISSDKYIGYSQTSKEMTIKDSDLNSTLLLLDLFIRRITGQKYISTVDQDLFSSEAQANVWNITNDIVKEFEQILKNAAVKSGIAVTNLRFDPTILSRIDQKISNGEHSQVLDILHSVARSACPNFPQTEKFLSIVGSNIKDVTDKMVLSKAISTELQRNVSINSSIPRSHFNSIIDIRSVDNSNLRLC